MKSPLQCDMLIPLGQEISPADDAGFPALQALLRYSRPEEHFSGDAAAWLCHRFGVSPQQDIPSAPYAALGDGLAAEDGYWLHADPVSLVLQRDTFALAPAPQALQPAQSEQLAEALNAYFHADGMHFYVASPRRWYLRLAQRPHLHTHALSAAVGRDIQPFLPTGADGLDWHRRLNELQMVLHAHPVNAALEEHGIMPVNSVWIWGGGEYVAGVRSMASVWSEDSVCRGLAKAHNTCHEALPQHAHRWLELADPEQPQLVVLPEIDANIERDWLAPCMELLRSGRIAHIRLHLAANARVRSYSLRRRDLLKFWRRARPLESYLG